MTEKLKLFVWEGRGVLQNYTSGMICVLAHNLEEALRLIEKKSDGDIIINGESAFSAFYTYCVECEKSSGISIETPFPVKSYKIITEPEAFLCHGGE